jgi:hypothetical protein
MEDQRTPLGNPWEEEIVYDEEFFVSCCYQADAIIEKVPRRRLRSSRLIVHMDCFGLARNPSRIQFRFAC